MDDDDDWRGEQNDPAGERLQDRELPDEADTDSFDGPSLDACPHCRKMVSEDAERCHHCGQYISQEDAPLHIPVWIWIGVIVLGISFVAWMFTSGKWP